MKDLHNHQKSMINGVKRLIRRLCRVSCKVKNTNHNLVTILPHVCNCVCLHIRQKSFSILTLTKVRNAKYNVIASIVTRSSVTAGSPAQHNEIYCNEQSDLFIFTAVIWELANTEHTAPHCFICISQAHILFYILNILLKKKILNFECQK